ncbi:hypothetical protein ACHAXM_005642, partial [Skeletonema potamos]
STTKRRASFPSVSNISKYTILQVHVAVLTTPKWIEQLPSVNTIQTDQPLHNQEMQPVSSVLFSLPSLFLDSEIFVQSFVSMHEENVSSSLSTSWILVEVW